MGPRRDAARLSAGSSAFMSEGVLGSSLLWPNQLRRTAMNRHAVGFWAAGVLGLALIPLMWAMGIAGLGSMAAASTVADTVMVWILSWGIVVVASLAAVM